MSNTDIKICEYCQTNIKNSSEVVVCPKCQTPYHPDCWLENGGCAVYGCGYKSSEDSEIFDTEKTDALVEIEFLINEKKYVEAIDECKTLLRLDKRNVALKKLYNKAVSNINAKTKLIEEGDNFFDSGDYQNASVFYNRAMRYCNEYDSSIIQSKLDIINHDLPIQTRRKKIGNFLTAFILIVIIFLGAATYYYLVVMEQEREFTKIELEDNLEDRLLTEIQISKYENFRQRNPEGKWSDKADEKINFMSAYLANQIYKDDWRAAKKYLHKINKERALNSFNEIEKRIYAEAMTELNEKIRNANNFNQRKNFTEAKYSIENALEIINQFDQISLNEKRQKLFSDLDLIKEKISLQVKYRNVVDEIEEKRKDIANFSQSTTRDYPRDKTIVITGTVTGNLGNGVISVKPLLGKEIALRTGGYRFSQGELITLESVRNGRWSIYNDGVEESIPMYDAVVPDRADRYSSLTDYERLALEQRLAYLISEKRKLDSLMQMKIQSK